MPTYHARWPYDAGDVADDDGDVHDDADDVDDAPATTRTLVAAPVSTSDVAAGAAA